MLSGVQSTAPAGRGRGSLRPPSTKDSQCQGPGLRRERRSTSSVRSAFFRPWGSALLRTLVLAEGCAALGAGSASTDCRRGRRDRPQRQAWRGELEGGEGTGAGKPFSASPFARLPRVRLHRLAEYRPHLGGTRYTGRG